MQCEIIQKLFRAIDSCVENEKIPRDYGTGELLSQGEIQFINVVFRHPGYNTKALAKHLRLTLGAITQWGNKLEEKGLVERFRKDGNKKEIYYRLTAKGEVARKGHLAYHEDANQKMCAYLSSHTSEEQKIIISFIEKVEELPISDYHCTENCYLRVPTE